MGEAGGPSEDWGKCPQVWGVGGLGRVECV